jgi:hypothetical protein
MKLYALSFLLLACSTISLFARTTGNEVSVKPLLFIENRGQIKDQQHVTRTDIQFALRTPGLHIFIGNGAIHYQFSTVADGTVRQRHFGPGSDNNEDEGPDRVKIYRMDVELVGADRHAVVSVSEPGIYYENHIAAGAGATDIIAHSFGRVVYHDVYPKIDWVLYTQNGALKHEFVVRLGGDPANIKLRYNGATDLRIGKNGDLIAQTPLGTVKEHAPYSYDANKHVVSSRFVLDGQVLQYQTGHYSGTLTIDPSVLWATYYGSTDDDVIFRVVRSSGGDIYSTGITNSVTGMATSGAHQTIEAGSDDAFLTRHDNAGNLLWATYYGGSANDRGWESAIDPAGNIYICGRTGSSSGIATSGSHQPSLTGLTDGFLAKFNSSGSRIWATYYGGYDWETASGVTCDASGNVYLVGQTSSTSNIASFGAWQTMVAGGDDGFIAKFTSAGVRVWGTYCGGPNNDEFYRAVVDGSGNIYLGGMGTSPSGIASAGAHQTVYGGGVKDAIFAKFSSTGSRLWCTYFGGSGDEYCWGITLDGAGNIYWAGNTSSTTAMATVGSHQTTYGGGVNDGFIAKFSPTGTIIWSTYYGGGGDDGLGDVTTDPSGNVYFAGNTNSTTGVITPGALQSTITGGADLLYGSMTTSGSLLYGSYYGGNADETGYTIINDGSGNVYISGFTNSTTGLATPGAHQSTYGGGVHDGFLLKIDQCTVPVVPAVTGTPTVCIAATTPLSNPTPGGSWSSGAPGIATVNASGVVAGIAGGTAIISYGISNTCGFGYALYTVTVVPLPTVLPLTGTTTVCVGGSVTFSCATASGVWSSTTPTVATVSTGGLVNGLLAGTSLISYTVTNACGSTASTRVVTVNGSPAVAPITGAMAGCTGGMLVLSSTTTGGTWSSSNLAVATIFPTASDGFISLVSPGTSTISYVVAGTCGSTTVNATVTVNALPVVAVITGPATVCAGSYITLSNATPGGSWSSLSPTVATAAAGGLISGVAAGTAVIRYTVTNSCGSTTVTANVTVTPLPVAGTITGPSEVCAGSSVTLSSTPTGGTWSSTTTTIATVSAGGMVSGIAPGTATIAYTVINSCGSALATANVTVAILPVVAAITGTTNVCTGNSATLSTTTTGGSWSSAMPLIATVSASGAATGIAPGTAVISYTVTNVCGATAATRTLNVLPASVCATAVNGIEAGEAGDGLTVWPSPNKGVFMVTYRSVANAAVHIIVTDVTGREIASLPAQTNKTTTVRIQTPGVYLVIGTSQTSRLVTRVVVE